MVLAAEVGRPRPSGRCDGHGGEEGEDDVRSTDETTTTAAAGGGVRR